MAKEIANEFERDARASLACGLTRSTAKEVYVMLKEKSIELAISFWEYFHYSEITGRCFG